MKKVLLSLMLLLASSFTMAASVEIHRLGSSSNIQSVNNLQMYQNGGRLDQIHVNQPFSLKPSTDALAVGWKLSSDRDVDFTLHVRTNSHVNDKHGNLTVNPHDWGVSILTADRDSIWSGNGLNFNINMSLKAGVDKIVRVTGITTAVWEGLFKGKLKGIDSFKTQLWTSNHEFKDPIVVPPPVSEVPLPAAVWLFGSALLGGFAVRRKRQKVKV